MYEGRWDPPKVVRELVEELINPLPSIYQQSWIIKEIPDDWRLVSVTTHVQEGPGGSRELQLCQPDLGARECYGADHLGCYASRTGCYPLHTGQSGIRPTWDGFMKGRSCLSSLVFFCDFVTRLVGVGKAVVGVCLNFGEDLETISHSILLEKEAVHGLDGRTFCWVKKWLDAQAQSVGVTGVKYSWWLVSLVFPRAQGRLQ